MKRSLQGLAVLAALSAGWACGSTFPTERDILDELERQLSSVAGTWEGTGLGNDVRVTMELTQAGTTVAGTGTFRESASAPTSAITVEGSYVRPRLMLTFSEFSYAGELVTGTWSGDYSTVAGILSAIELSGQSGGSIQLLLQEISP